MLEETEKTDNVLFIIQPNGYFTSLFYARLNKVFSAHLLLEKWASCSTRFLLNLLGNWRECVWAAVFKSISLRLDPTQSRTNLCFIKLSSVLLQPLFDSWAANNLKPSEEKDKERTANQIFSSKSILSFAILDSLLIPFNSQMKKWFWNFKGSLENSFKA